MFYVVIDIIGIRYLSLDSLSVIVKMFLYVEPSD